MTWKSSQVLKVIQKSHDYDISQKKSQSFVERVTERHRKFCYGRCGDRILITCWSVIQSLIQFRTHYSIEKTKRKSGCLLEEFADNGNGYSCARCGKVFSYEYYRDKHLKYTRCVDNGNRKFPCSTCNRYHFMICSSLRFQHISTHSTLPDFPRTYVLTPLTQVAFATVTRALHKCHCRTNMPFCRSFEKRDRLRIHILHVHENHRPHVCSVCQKSFSQSSSLNKVEIIKKATERYSSSSSTCEFTPGNAHTSVLTVQRPSPRLPFWEHMCDNTAVKNLSKWVNRRKLDIKPIRIQFMCWSQCRWSGDRPQWHR